MKKNLLLSIPADILIEFLKFPDLADFLALVVTCKTFKELLNGSQTNNICWQVFYSAFPYLHAEKYTSKISNNTFGTMGLGFQEYFQNFTNAICTNRFNRESKYRKIMKMTWLEETGHLEQILQFLGQRNLKGHPITRKLKQYLPSVNFEKLINGEQSLPNLEKEIEFEHKKSLDLIFNKISDSIDDEEKKTVFK